jgi:hypothetical protein
VTVSANPALIELELDALTSTGGLSIGDNDSLPQCAVDELDARLGFPCNEACTGNDPDAPCP